MPGGDRTGPLGCGPKTGRASGYCTGNRMPGYANPAGRGFGGGAGFGFDRRGGGFGGGFGRGRRNRFFFSGGPWLSRQGAYGFNRQGGYADSIRDEKEYLMAEAENFKAMLTDINKRLDEISASGKGDS